MRAMPNVSEMQSTLPAQADTPTDHGVQAQHSVHALRALRARLAELESTHDSLQQQLDATAHRLDVVRHELSQSALRVGQPPLARVMHVINAWQADLATAARHEPEAAPTPAAWGAPVTPLRQRLSAREREVLSLLTEGSRSPCIAARLGICNATVEVHRRNISRKLGLHGVAELTKYALRQGLTRLWT